MNAFQSYHPLVNFTYFTAVILYAMFLMHPVCLGISLICALLYAIILNGKKAAVFQVACLLPLLLFSALVNVAFNHEGRTILAYFPNGNPLTLESLAYGLAAAAMIVTVISWFSCYNAVMTSDKFIYLFGRVMPSLSLVLSMALRFVPRFQAQARVIASAQKGVGRDLQKGSVIQRAKNGMTILSILVTWALENAVETAQSMKSRGYGLPGRTAYHTFRFSKRDGAALALIAVSALYVLAGKICGAAGFRYFPSLRAAQMTPYSISVFAAYGILCATPIIIELWEERKWRAIKSRI